MKRSLFQLNPVPDKPGWFQLECIVEFTPYPTGFLVKAGELGGLVQGESCIGHDFSWIAQGASADATSVVERSFIGPGSHLVNTKVKGSEVVGSDVDNSVITSASLNDARVCRSNVLGGSVQESSMFDSNSAHSNVRCQSFVNKTHLQGSQLKTVHTEHSSIVNCVFRHMTTNDSVWSNATPPVVHSAFGDYTAYIAGYNLLAVGCQIFTFEEWLDHETATNIMMEADPDIDEMPDDWDSFELLVRFMRERHNVLVSRGNLAEKPDKQPDEVQT